MPRNFAAASSDGVVLGIGGCTSVGARTFLALVRLTDDAADKTIFSAGSATTGSNRWILNILAGGIMRLQDGDNTIDPSASLSVLAADGWTVCGFSKPAGNPATPRFHKYSVFPIVPIVDNFNRANEGPPMTGWTAWMSTGLKVVSNQCAPNDGLDNGGYFTSAMGGPDVEASVTIATLPANGGQTSVIARGNPTGAGFNGSWYAAYHAPDAGTDTIGIEWFDSSGAGSTILGSWSQDLAAGDILRIRCVGSSIQAWAFTGGRWILVGQVTDTNIAGTGSNNKVGIYNYGNGGTGARYDNFSAGTIVSPSWTHEAASGTLGDITAPGTSAYFGRKAAGSPYMNGDIAWGTFWGAELTDTQIEAAGYERLAHWQQTPAGMWVLDQSAVGQKIKDLTGNGADESSISGTSVSAVSVVGFNYGDTPGIVTIDAGTATLKSDTDTGTGTDTAVVTVKADSDSGAGVDTGSVVISGSTTPGGSDSGTGYDGAVVAVTSPVTPSHITDGASATNGTAYTTASFAPAANALCLVTVLSIDGSSDPAAPTLSGGGMTTWTQVASQLFNTPSAARARITLFRALQASPGAPAVLTITHGATMQACTWSVDQFASVDTGGSNGANAVVQSVSGSGTGQTANAALAALGDPDNIIYGGVAHVIQESVSPLSGATETADRNNGDATTPGNLETAWAYRTEDISWGWATDSAYGFIGIEIKAPSGGLSAGTPSDVPTVVFEMNLNDPTSTSKQWADLSSRVISWTWDGPKRSFELDSMGTGTLQVTCRNHDRALDPRYASGPYYGRLFSNREVRFGLYWKGRWRWLFYGLIEDFEFGKMGFSGLVTIKANDAIDLLGQETLQNVASYTTAMTGSNNDLVFTAAGGNKNPTQLATMETPHAQLLGGQGHAPGVGAANAEEIKIEIGQYGTTANTQVVITYLENSQTLVIHAGSNGAGNCGCTAQDVMDAVNSSSIASARVVASLAPGNDGTGLVKTTAAQPLTGGFAQEPADNRIVRVVSNLDTPWNLGDLVLDVGVEMIQSSSILKKDNVGGWTHIQEVGVYTELGIVYPDGQGRLVFRNRTHRDSAAVKATLTDIATGGEYSYSDIKPHYDNKKIYNEIVVTPNGTSTPATATDAASISKFRKRSRTLTVLCAIATSGSGSGSGGGGPGPPTDRAQTIANLLLAKFKDQKLRYDTVTLQALPGDATMVDFLLDLDISDLLTIKENPPAGPGISSPLVSSNHFVEGVALSQNEDRTITCTLALSPQ